MGFVLLDFPFDLILICDFAMILCFGVVGWVFVSLNWFGLLIRLFGGSFVSLQFVSFDYFDLILIRLLVCCS